MVEPVAPPEPPVAPPAAPPIPLVNSDGELREGWTGILDEDLRDESYLKEAKTLQGIARSVVSARAMVGKDKIVKPNEASSEADWDAYYVAGGRPDTAGDYNLTRPDELPEENYNQDLANAAQDLFHKIGLSQKQADALFAFNNNNVIALLAKNAQDSEFAAKTLKDGLYAKWGNAFEQKKHLGNVAVESGTLGDVEFKDRLLQKFGNDPDFIEYSANLGSKFAEAGSPDAKMIPTPSDIQARIDEETHKASYGLDYAKHGFTKAQHKAQVDLVSRLFQEKVSSTKTG